MKYDPRNSTDWTTGNSIDLLENGEQYFPRLFSAIDSAACEIVLETYIWENDAIGRELARRMAQAARRGVKVVITIDGYGTPRLAEDVLEELNSAGVNVYWFDASPAWFRIRTNWFCRLHRKIVVIDDKTAFVGGINVWALQLRRSGPESMQDYAVSVEGPVVARIREAMRRSSMTPKTRPWRRWRRQLRRVPGELSRPAHDGLAMIAVRDNGGHDFDIEAMYRIGLRHARKSILIANAYFFPGYRFLRDLARAARRGVDVRLILQGKADVPFAAIVASLLYGYLRAAGVRIYLYTERPMHAKVAVIDGNWSTVGSSNLDPISLGLNLEANLFFLDRPFAAKLRDSLETLIANSCEAVTAKASRQSVFSRLALLAVYHLTRRMPQWGQFMVRRSQVAKAMDAGLDA